MEGTERGSNAKLEARLWFRRLFQYQHVGISNAKSPCWGVTRAKYRKTTQRNWVCFRGEYRLKWLELFYYNLDVCRGLDIVQFL